jgi:molecular chaperone DnaK (HSP70)
MCQNSNTTRRLEPRAILLFMRLGIDFGTTRIVVAAVDRGNYPVIAFEDAEGIAHEWFPPLIATRGSTRLYGWDAWAVQADPDWTVLRSLKRSLEDAGPMTTVQAGDSVYPMLQLLEELAAALESALLEKSTLPSKSRDRLEIMLGVPANANSNQRFLTVEPFQRAGFIVEGLLNEPSAASIEYGHRTRTLGSAEQVLVYDLGGGTFDASLVRIEDRSHTVIASEGVPNVGGDDFDIVLGDMALGAASLDPAELTQGEMFRLHEECRARKESLHPNTRRIVVDLGVVREGLPDVTIPAADYYDACDPLVQRTIDATQRLLDAHDEGQKLDALYVTGGGSELPVVVRSLREKFGRRVKRSAYTRSATAIGLAIQADVQAGYVLREGFTRHFGVWRETDCGRSVSFDVLFPKGTPLPLSGQAPLTIERNYHPVHNLGHFRYIECSHRTDEGKPTGDIAIWDEIRFAFDPALSHLPDLGSIAVKHAENEQQQCIRERYTCSAGGSVEVEISNVSAGYARRFRLGKWAGGNNPVVPGRRKKHKTETR